MGRVLALALLLAACCKGMTTTPPFPALTRSAASPSAPLLSKRSKRGKYPRVELWVDEETYTKEERNGERFLKERLGYTEEQVADMTKLLPSLRTMDAAVLGFKPKFSFLTRTMNRDKNELVAYPEVFQLYFFVLNLPAGLTALPRNQYLGRQLVKDIAPRYAFWAKDNHSEKGSVTLRDFFEAKDEDFAGTTYEEFRHFRKLFFNGPFEAARSGSDQLLRDLAHCGWRVEERDRRGCSTLHYASGSGQLGAMQVLVDELGLSPNDVSNENVTPAHWAAAGVTKHTFASGGHIEAIKWLLHRGADGMAVDCHGNTILMFAALAAGNLALTKFLCEEAGLDSLCKNKNKNGCTVAHWAASGGDLATCKYLAENRGVSFSLGNNVGNSALNKAVAHSRKDVVRWLLDEGALNTLTDEDEEELVALARLVGSKSIEEMIRRR